MDFNDIKNAWKDSLKDEELLNKQEIEAKLNIKRKSNTALNKVKWSYKVELLIGSTASLFVIIWMLINVDSKNKAFIISIAVLFFGSLLFFAWSNFRRIRKVSITSEQLKPTLQKTIKSIERYVGFNKSFFTKYLLLPFSVIFGLTIGLHIGSGYKGLLEILSLLEKEKITYIIIVGLTAIVFVIPFSQFLNRKMYKQHLDELKQCLKEFEEIEE